MPGVLVAIPVFNEIKYVADVLKEVSKHSKNILVVNDGSTDGTSKTLESYPHIQIISHEHNEGYGQSLIDVFSFAYRNNFEWVITIDCDFQHEPAYIEKFYSEIEKDDADIISGSRYLSRMNLGSIPPPKDRVAINKRITRIFNRELNMGITDAFCGFKSYRTEAISRLELDEKGYAFPLQLWVKAARANLKIREIPVPLIYHSPKRNFQGLFEMSAIRFDYYMKVIRRELGYNVCENIGQLECA